MHILSCVKRWRLVGFFSLAGAFTLTQVPALVAVPQQSKSGAKSSKAEIKLKAIWEPANVKEDIELESVHFVTPEEGWVAGGRTNMQGGVILHTADAGANWEIQLGDPQSSDRAYYDFRFASPTMGWAVQSTGVGDHKLLHLDGKEWKDVGMFRSTAATIALFPNKWVLLLLTLELCARKTEAGTGKRFIPVK